MPTSPEAFIFQPAEIAYMTAALWDSQEAAHITNKSLQASVDRWNEDIERWLPEYDRNSPQFKYLRRLGMEALREINDFLLYGDWNDFYSTIEFND